MKREEKTIKCFTLLVAFRDNQHMFTSEWRLPKMIQLWKIISIHRHFHNKGIHHTHLSPIKHRNAFDMRTYQQKL